MSTLVGYRPQAPRPSAGRRAAGGLMMLPLIALLAAAVVGLGYVIYALWPRWPDAPVAADAPALPIMIGGVLFNVQPQVIREAIQRRAGTQGRLDLVYLWPSLAPPGPATPNLGEHDRVFVTLAVAASLPPLERLKSIYPRYIETAPTAGPEGLSIFLFRDGTPYQGEDLVFDAQAPEKFLARCARTVNPLTPGTCLAERRIEGADIMLRFPREWLAQWRDVESGFEKLATALRAPAGQ